MHAPTRFSRGSAPGGGGLPTIVFVHGGAWAWSRAWQHSPLCAHWARCGAVCVNVDYRLYPRADALDMATDVAHAIRWASSHAGAYGGDPTRLMLMGHSSGAHVATLALLLHAEAAAAVAGALMLCGVFDVPAHFEFEARRSIVGGAVRGVHWLSPLAPACGGVGRLEDVSPRHLIAARAAPVPPSALPPFTLLHAGDDEIVPPSQSAAFGAALRSAGVPVTCVPPYERVRHMDVVVDPMVGYAAGCTARLTEDVFAAIAATPPRAPPPPARARSAL